ncbi:unnamed protein product [Dibothriocephalus latus]|uniref:Uncharacterized protein n=1 Tax=Dibothriocephalus latus TaxID=60516 RepID=A0A3P6SZQ5_DIBLA|nr:unnamed protein product [Dibothriocephalus latus]
MILYSSARKIPFASSASDVRTKDTFTPLKQSTAPSLPPAPLSVLSRTSVIHGTQIPRWIRRRSSEAISGWRKFAENGHLSACMHRHLAVNMAKKQSPVGIATQAGVKKSQESRREACTLIHGVRTVKNKQGPTWRDSQALQPSNVKLVQRLESISSECCHLVEQSVL